MPQTISLSTERPPKPNKALFLISNEQFLLIHQALLKRNRSQTKEQTLHRNTLKIPEFQFTSSDEKYVICFPHLYLLFFNVQYISLKTGTIATSEAW